jgi:hypothetical protein
MAEAFGRTRRVDAVSQSVFVNETISAIADELDAIQFVDVIGGLFQHLAIHGDVVFRVEIEFSEAQENFVHADDYLAAKEGKVHSIERGAVSHEHAAFARMSVLQHGQSAHGITVVGS